MISLRTLSFWFASIVAVSSIACGGDGGESNGPMEAGGAAGHGQGGSSGQGGSAGAEQGAGKSGGSGQAGSDQGGVCRSFPRWLGWGGEDNDRATAVTTRPDGSVVVGGFQGSLSFEPFGETRSFLAQVDRDGIVGPVLHVDRAGVDSIDALQTDASGRVIFAARTVHDGLEPHRDDQTDVLVGSIEPDGTLSRWIEVGDERPQAPRSLALAPDGSVLIGGHDEVWVPSNYVEDWQNPFVYRVSKGADGTYSSSFVRRDRTPILDTSSALTVGKDGDIFATRLVAGGPDQGAHVRRLDPAGTERWSQRLTTMGIDGAEAIGWGKDGSLLVAGASYKPIGEEKRGGPAFVAALDPRDGTTRWTWQGASHRDSWSTAMTVADDGSIYLAGETAVTDADGSMVSTDAFVWKLSQDGKSLGSWHGTTEADDSVTGIALGACGRIHVVGASTARDGGPVQSGYDAFLLTLSDEDLTLAP